MLARLYHRMGAPEKAAQALERQVRDYPGATDLTHINILAELFMDCGRHQQAVNLIRSAEQLPCMQDGTPLDLTVSTAPRRHPVPYSSIRWPQVGHGAPLIYQMFCRNISAHWRLNLLTSFCASLLCRTARTVERWLISVLIKLHAIKAKVGAEGI